MAEAEGILVPKARPLQPQGEVGVSSSTTNSYSYSSQPKK